MSSSSKNDGSTVVFGGTGFIGTHFLQALVARGERQLISVDIKPADHKIEGVTYIEHDIRDLTNLKIEGPIRRIANFAAVHTTPGHEPWEYYDANIRGALQITHFARQNDVQQIIFTSSISVYGPDEQPKDESTPPTPTSDYGRSKLISEMIHQEWQQANPAHRLVIARPAVVFGLGEGGNFTRLASVLKKGFFIFPGRRDTIKSCIYVGDLVEWMLKAEAMEDNNILFNGTYSNRYTVEDIVDTFRKESFPKVRTFLLPAALLKTAAKLMRPMSSAGLGIHPERIEKLMKSTNILPTWAEQHNFETRDRLEIALKDWERQSGGSFQ